MGRLRAALRELPSGARSLLSMFYLDEMPIALIAELLAIPQGTVKSRLHNARGKLKEVLERSER